MALSPTAANAVNPEITDDATWVSLHTGPPGTTGANEVTGGAYTREQTTWGAISGGSRTGSQVSVDVPSGVTVTHWGLHTLASAGVYYAGFELDVAETFGAPGQYLLTPTVAVE